MFEKLNKISAVERFFHIVRFRYMQSVVTYSSIKMGEGIFIP